MYGGVIYIWTCIISAVVILLGYTIWNVIVVLKSFVQLSKEVQKDEG